ncbi:MAG: TPM domain-containing protein [Bacteroidales bacterium]|nr:TPM domain-containing protein [Bacteroidales bacterium]
MVKRFSLSVMVVALAVVCAMCNKSDSQQGEASAEAAATEQVEKAVLSVKDLPERPEMMANDYAGVLGDSIRGLEDDLRRYAAEVPVQIAVVTLSDIGANDALKVASEIGNKWGVGDKEKDNGVVILIQPKTEKAEGKVAIAPGAGLKQVLSDEACNRIIEDIMVPQLKAGDYYGAVSAAVLDIVSTLSASK